MEIKLRFIPEKPAESSKVIIFNSYADNKIGGIYVTSYSKYWDAFYMFDNDEVMKKTTKEANESVVAWTYLDEFNEEFTDEINR